jgi:hypothetical protein
MNTAQLGTQLIVVFILALPVACIAWTVTHEEVFREVHEWLLRRVETSRTILQRKFFYLFTCEYCFSHWVTMGVLALTGFTLLFKDWRGYVLAGFSIVWVANFYMSLFARLRLNIKHEREEIQVVEQELGIAPAPEPRRTPYSRRSKAP